MNKEQSQDIETQPPKEKRKIAIVETSEAIEQEARDIAEAKLTEKGEKAKGIKEKVKLLIRKVWVHNYFHEYYRQKEIHKVKREITGKDNIYAGTTEEELSHKEAMRAVVERFVSEYEEIVHKEAGEKKEKLSGSEDDIKIKLDIKDIISRYAKGEIPDEKVFQEEKNKMFSKLKGVKKNVIEKGNLYADNLFEIAEESRKAIEYGERLEDLDLDFEVIIGRAKMGVRTEAQFNAVDRIVDKIQRLKLGKIEVGKYLNEATVASAVSITYSLGTIFSQRVASSKALAWASFGGTAMVSSAFAGTREGKRFEEERRQHAREMAKSKTFEPSKMSRRKEMEEFRYETTPANEIAENLNSSVKDYDGSNEKYDLILANIAEAQSRIKISDRQKIDLISYSDSKLVEKERLNLDIALAKAKIKANEINSNSDISINSLTETRILEIIKGERGIEKKNALFKKMKSKKVANAALKGLVTGLIIGGTIQEITAFFRDDQQGLLEAALGGQDAGAKQLTPLEYLRYYMAGGTKKITETLADENLKTLGSVDRVINYQGHKLNFKLPPEVNILENKDGSFNLEYHKNILAHGLKINPNGSLTEETKKMLGANGINFISNPISKITEGAEKINLTPADFVKGHMDKFDKIHRVLWYDNDTPGVFDKNELALWWGGHGNTGIDAKGNFVFNISQMTSGGSHHENFSVDAVNAIKEGKIKMLFSMSENTQKTVLEVPIDAHGNAVIDPKSDIGRLLFTKSGGHAVFNGRYAEVVESVGQKNGEEQFRVLATYEGKGIKTIKDVMTLKTQKIDHYNTIMDIPTKSLKGALKYDWTMPAVVPLAGRNPLETIEYIKSIEETKEKEAETAPKGAQNIPEEKLPEAKRIGFFENWGKRFNEIVQGLSGKPKEKKSKIEQDDEAIKDIMKEYEKIKEKTPEKPVESKEEKETAKSYEQFTDGQEIEAKIIEKAYIKKGDKKENAVLHLNAIYKDPMGGEIKFYVEDSKRKELLDIIKSGQKIKGVLKERGKNNWFFEPKLETEEKPESKINELIRKLIEKTPKNVDFKQLFHTAATYAWQTERYGENLKNNSDNLYRGYLMVEPKDIPFAVEIIRKIAEDRLKENKTTYFKWLIGRSEDPKNLMKIFDGEYGLYEDMEDTDPRLVFYGDKPDDIKEIIKQITQDKRWLTYLTKISKERAGKARRPGTNAYIDEKGFEWRVINYNNMPGYSEDEARDPNWRENKFGGKTVKAS